MSIASFLFSFEGRIRRQWYWLFSIAALVALVLVSLFLLDMVDINARPPFAWTAISLAYLYPATAVTVKRANDIGWPPVTAYFISAATGVYSLFEQFQPFGPLYSASTGNIVMWLVMLGAVILAIVVGCIRGVTGPNVHGPDPLAAG